MSKVKDLDSEVLKELIRRKSKPDVLSYAFDKQLDFIEDPAKLKAALCTRRAGKSLSSGIYLFSEAIKYPGSTCIYLALTRDSAYRIMFKDVLKKIDRDLNLGTKFNEAPHLKATLPNGSVIYLLGADKDKNEVEKLLGQAFRLCVVDECASYRQNLKEIVYKYLLPATIDYEGSIVLIGTPGDNIRSFFYNVTTGKEEGWSVHKWTSQDNPHVAEKERRVIERLKKQNPKVIETPWFKQMYQGEWFIDESKLVYKFNEERNLISALPKAPDRVEYIYTMGIDLGFEDATAISVVAYQPHDRNLYIVETYKSKHLDITAAANKIKEIASRYKIVKYVVDNASKQAVEEIKNRHGIPLEPAEKINKYEFIQLMNSEMIQGYIKLLPGNEELIDQYYSLVWDDSGRNEFPGLPNDNCDSVLYPWRYCYNFYSQKYNVKPSIYTQEFMDSEIEKEIERAKNDIEKDSWDHLFPGFD